MQIFYLTTYFPYPNYNNGFELIPQNLYHCLCDRGRPIEEKSVFYFPARARIKQKSGAQKHMSKLNIGAVLQSAAASSRGNQIQ